MLDSVLGHLQDISESYESQRDNLPENLQGSSKEDELSEKAEAIQQVTGQLEDLISGLDGNDDYTYDEEGNELDSGKCATSEIRLKPPRFLGGSRPKQIVRLIQIIEAVASMVKPQNPQAAEEISEVAADLENTL